MISTPARDIFCSFDPRIFYALGIRNTTLRRPVAVGPDEAHVLMLEHPAGAHALQPLKMTLSASWIRYAPQVW
jgi:hypothetical protein